MTTETKLIAFHGDPQIKEKYLARVRAHRKADEIVKGKYWENGKGCAVGCTIHGDDHARYEVELGIPKMLARLEDGIFENLPNGKALQWPEQFLEAVVVGADLSLVGSRFLHWLLVDPADGVIRFARDEKVAIQRVADLYQRKINGDTVTASDWNKSAQAATYATQTATYAATYATQAATYATEAAAYAAYAARAAYAVYAARIRQSEKLLELLRDAK